MQAADGGVLPQQLVHTINLLCCQHGPVLAVNPLKDLGAVLADRQLSTAGFDALHHILSVGGFAQDRPTNRLNRSWTLRQIIHRKGDCLLIGETTSISGTQPNVVGGLDFKVRGSVDLKLVAADGEGTVIATAATRDQGIGEGIASIRICAAEDCNR